MPNILQLWTPPGGLCLYLSCFPDSVMDHVDSCHCIVAPILVMFRTTSFQLRHLCQYVYPKPRGRYFIFPQSNFSSFQIHWHWALCHRSGYGPEACSHVGISCSLKYQVFLTESPATLMEMARMSSGSAPSYLSSLMMTTPPVKGAQENMSTTHHLVMASVSPGFSRPAHRTRFARTFIKR